MGGPSFCRLIGICHQVPDLGSGQPSKKRTGSGAKILCFVFGTLVPERRGHLDPLEGLGNRPEPAHLVQRDPFHADHRARLVASLVSSFRTPPGWNDPRPTIARCWFGPPPNLKPSWFSRVKTLAMRVELRRLLGMLYILVRCTRAEGAPWARAFPAHQGERKPGEHHPCVSPSQAGRRFGEAKSGPMDLFRKKNASHTEQTQEKQEKEQREEEAAPRNHLFPRRHSGSASASA